MLHVERFHLFLDAQLQLQPIQPGEHSVCELWIAWVCNYINNGWGREMAGLLWFVRTTTDAVQTKTPNWMKTRDIWWSVSAELACRTNMTKICLSWQHLPTCRQHYQLSVFVFDQRTILIIFIFILIIYSTVIFMIFAFDQNSLCDLGIHNGTPDKHNLWV